MVGSLGWLCHDPSQAPDLLYQANAVIRKLLSVGQLELAAQAAAKIPKETLTRVVKAWQEEGSGEEVVDIRRPMQLRTRPEVLAVSFICD